MAALSPRWLWLLALIACKSSSPGERIDAGAGSGSSSHDGGVVDAGMSAPGAPHLLYSDLVSASGTGGDNGNGAYVNLYGTHLAAITAVTVGGQPAIIDCAACASTDRHAVFQLGPAAATGDLVVTTAMGASNALPFTVTPTDYYFVGPAGSDSNAGTFAAPFATLRPVFTAHAPVTRNTVIYLLDGLALTANDGTGNDTSAYLDSGGVGETDRLNVVAYPGAVATAGAPSAAAEYGMKTYADYVTVAGLHLRGYSAFNGYPEIGHLRFIANDISCQQVPAAFGDNACVEIAASASDGAPSIDTKFYGNTVHDTGSAVADKTYHAVYFSTDLDDSEAAWNTIGTGVFYGYCRSMLLHSSNNGNPNSGQNQYGWEIHDNYIQKGWCDGIGLASVDPSKGAIDVYNNVIANTGVPSDGTTTPPPDGNNAGIAINTDDDGASSGVVNIYNNTLYAAGVYASYSSNGCFGVVAAGATAMLTNNVCDQPAASEPYIEPADGGEVAGAIAGSHNLWFGNGAVPSFDATGLGVDPEFANPIDYATAATFAVGVSETPPVGAPVADGVP